MYAISKIPDDDSNQCHTYSHTQHTQILSGRVPHSGGITHRLTTTQKENVIVINVNWDKAHNIRSGYEIWNMAFQPKSKWVRGRGKFGAVIGRYNVMQFDGK